MDEKLILKRPDSQQAVAPMNRYEIADKPERKRGRMLLSALFLGGLGSVFAGRDEAGGNTPAHQPLGDDGAIAPEPEQPTGPDLAGALDVVNDVADYFRELMADFALTTGTVPTVTGRLRASVRLSFDDGRPDTGLVDDRPLQQKARSANDNGLESFNFPRLSSFGNLPSSGGRKDDDDNDDDHGGGDDDNDDGNGNGNGGNNGGNNNGGGNNGGDDDDDDDGATRTNRLPVVTGRNILANGFMNLSAIILLDDLLANTLDPDGDRLTIANLTVSSGSVRAYADGMWLYTPDRGDIGEVTFSYTVSDGSGSVANGALLSLLDWPANEIKGTEGPDVLLGTPRPDIIAALGGDDIVYGREDDDLILGGTGNDTLLGGDGNDTLHGEDGDDRLFGGNGNDILFGGAGNDQLYGEAGDDILIGEAGDDTLSGGTGDDRLFGEDGKDRLEGDAGDDLVDGGSEDDTLAGGTGDDTVLAGAGNDVIVTGPSSEEARLAQASQATPAATTDDDDGDDHYSGGTGFDTLDASTTTNTIVVDLEAGTASGEEIGSDTLDSIEAVIAGSGDDQLSGDAACNTLIGNDGDDTIDGRAGDDTLTGGNGDDTVKGGNGNDTVLVQARAEDHSDDDDGDDTYEGGAGTDTLDASATTESIVVDLEEGTATGEEIGSDTLDSIETVIAGSGDDELSGDAANNTLVGNDGNDAIDGRDGDDTLAGGWGDDVVSGGGGDDTIVVEAPVCAPGETSDGNDTYTGGTGFDTLDASATTESIVVDLEQGTATGEEIGSDTLQRIEAVIGGSGDDQLSGDAEGNTLFGNDGNDVIDGRAGNDTLAGGQGNDTVSGDQGNDTVIVVVAEGAGNDGNDSYSGGDGIDTLDMSALVQAVLADIEAGIAEGEEIGSDLIDGFDVIVGGDGGDRLSGGAGNNILSGGEGNDVLRGRGGDDVLVGGGGSDKLEGNTGNDTFLVVIAPDASGDDGNDLIDGNEAVDTYDASAAMQAVVIDLDRGTAEGVEIGTDLLTSVEGAVGGKGDDVLIAGNAVNFLAGGDGADIFVFRTTASLANDGSGRDEIRDFEVGDRVDLSKIAEAIGGLVFGGLLEDGQAREVHQITFYHETFGDGERTVVRAVVDLERDEDLQFLIAGRHELTEQDFILAATENPADQSRDTV
ncbi:cadherin-like domain-containing protein [Ensifer sp. HO-A22]|uniref:Cadherin-like domain-containing protein n=1 Tax=Ensifer oleiphilus TaxID=2742698 RepID=A0A7Y6UQW7_9HYPH|nr:cadherin-like domain-containing protein [Ensifer oleiphilus]NVD42945.1 cadherin-like domain-containing protein [Ensifer oleiphilus]